MDLNTYWRAKVNRVVKIAKERGYDSYDKEFWEKQDAGVISLIIDLYITDTNQAIRVDIEGQGP